MGSALIGMLADGVTDGGIVILGMGLGKGVPMVIAVVGITWAQISKSLRYSIAPTPDGVRITYGLLTTVTETLPPGRILRGGGLAVAAVAPVRLGGRSRSTGMSGKSAAQQSSGSGQQFNVVLPVGKRADVERVLALVLPDVPAESIPFLWEQGIVGPADGRHLSHDGAARAVAASVSLEASWLPWSPTSGLLLRRGNVWRKLAVFPLARLQGVLPQPGTDRSGTAESPARRVHTVPRSHHRIPLGVRAGGRAGADRRGQPRCRRGGLSRHHSPVERAHRCGNGGRSCGPARLHRPAAGLPRPRADGSACAAGSSACAAGSSACSAGRAAGGCSHDASCTPGSSSCAPDHASGDSAACTSRECPCGAPGRAGGDASAGTSGRTPGCVGHPSRTPAAAAEEERR